MYVFAYSWTPEFCYGHSTDYPGCSQPQAYWGANFTIHGLWPQYITGGYPQTCTSEALDDNVINQVGYANMVTHWPNVQAAEGSSTYDSFWQHEWSKHGTCSGLTQYNYFSQALNVQQRYPTPAILQANIGGTVAATDLRNAMGGKDKVALQCTSGKYVVGAYSCWSQKDGIPQALVTCPVDVQGEDTCTASSLIIQKFA